MGKKINEVTINGVNIELKPKSMTITQLPCTTKKESIKVFNQLKKTIPAHYKAAMVKYDFPTADVTGDIYAECPYYMIVSQYKFLGFSWVKGF